MKIKFFSLLALSLTLGIPSISWAGPKYLYVADSGADRIFRKDLETGELISLLTNDQQVQSPIGVALIESVNRIYWTQWNGKAPASIGEATLKGENVSFHTPQTAGSNALDLNSDAPLKALYWIQTIPTYQIRAFDITTQTETAFTPPSSQTGPKAIAVDESNGDVYYVDSSVFKIKKKDADGKVTVIANASMASDLALDLPNNKIYWTDLNTNQIKFTTVGNTTSAPQVLLPNFNSLPMGLVIDSSSSPSILYWSDGYNAVYRYPLNNSINPELIIEDGDGIISPRGLALGKALPLTNNTVIEEAPQVTVDNSTRKVTLTFEDFGTPVLESATLAATTDALAATNLKVRYIANITNKTNNLVKKIVTRNTSATFKLAPGTYTAKYKASIVKNVSAAKKAARTEKLNSEIATLKSKTQTIARKNRIQSKKAALKLAGFKTKSSTEFSPETAEFQVAD
jgi:hypothetical protein